MSGTIARHRLQGIASLHGVSVSEVIRTCGQAGIRIIDEPLHSGSLSGWRVPKANYTHSVRG